MIIIGMITMSVIVHYRFILYPAGILKIFASMDWGSSMLVTSWMTVVPLLSFCTFFITMPCQT